MDTDSANDRSVLEEGERLVARVWRLLAFRGVVAIAFAIVLLVWPDIGLTAMVGVVGAFAIASGFVAGAAAYALPSAAKEYRIWLGLNSILGLLVGTAMLVWPDLSGTALLYAIAIWAIGEGVLEIFAAFTLPISGSRTILIALSGVVLMGFGIVMFVEPGDGAVALLALVSAFAFVRGVFDVALAVELRRLLSDVKERMPSHAHSKPVTHG